MMCNIWGTVMFYTSIHSLYMARWHCIPCTMILMFEMGFTRYKFSPHGEVLQL
jgi:hypothetical protein